MKALLSIGEAARQLGLSVDTVREMERSGELRAARTPGGHRRFEPAVLDAYQEQRSGGRRQPRRGRAPTENEPRASRRTRMRRANDEPPDQPPDGWDDGPFEPTPPRPAAPAPKSAHEQLMEQITRTTERLTEQNRIGNLKSYGRSLIPYGASASARSAVLEAVDSYVTASRFPPSMAAWEARQAIDARIEAILEPFKAAAEREAAQKAKADAERAEGAREEALVRSLIERGKSQAQLKTLGWDYEDAKEARADVEEALDDEVEANWSERDVDELVTEVLEEWEEGEESED